jgi:hypothetical protein
VAGRELAAGARIAVEGLDALVAAGRSLQVLSVGADRETTEAVGPVIKACRDAAAKLDVLTGVATRTITLTEVPAEIVNGAFSVVESVLDGELRGEAAVAHVASALQERHRAGQTSRWRRDRAKDTEDGKDTNKGNGGKGDSKHAKKN